MNLFYCFTREKSDIEKFEALKKIEKISKNAKIQKNEK